MTMVSLMIIRPPPLHLWGNIETNLLLLLLPMLSLLMTAPHHQGGPLVYHPKTHSRMHLPPTRERMLLWDNSLVVDQLWVLKIGRDHDVAVVERVMSCKHRLLPVYRPFYYYWMNEELIAT
jgi:hypothetical protein